MATRKTVPASEFTRNFGRYRMRAQREAVAVSSHGQITGYFVSADEYEELKRFRESRRSFATAELPEEKVKAIAASRMDPRHAHLDRMLDPK
jgi:PHD/YefM family antitoxin component YafN of YafNO toxin-antitoxin module